MRGGRPVFTFVSLLEPWVSLTEVFRSAWPPRLRSKCSQQALPRPEAMRRHRGHRDWKHTASNSRYSDRGGRMPAVAAVPNSRGTHTECDRCTCSGRQWRWRLSWSIGRLDRKGGRPLRDHASVLERYHGTRPRLSLTVTISPQVDRVQQDQQLMYVTLPLAILEYWLRVILCLLESEQIGSDVVGVGLRYVHIWHDISRNNRLRVLQPSY